MAIREKGALTHLGVRVDGAMRPLCRAWRSSWNWTLVRAEVTCRECRAARASSEGDVGPGAPRAGAR